MFISNPLACADFVIPIIVPPTAKPAAPALFRKLLLPELPNKVLLILFPSIYYYAAKKL